MNDSAAIRDPNRKHLLASIPDDWRSAIQGKTAEGSIELVADFLAGLTATETYPAETEIFRALRLTPLDTVKSLEEKW